MKRLLTCLLFLATMATTHAQDIVVSEKTAIQIESIRTKAAKESADADSKMRQEIEDAKKQVEIDKKKAAQDAKKKMEQDTKKGAENAQKNGEKSIAMAKRKAEKTKNKVQKKADEEIARIRAKSAINF
ncbi:MAG: hypothetical protein LBU84_04395 [Prevotella sp.]|jgi:colicin import membrane protein|nr:hypothetical protein [Prevotella sp.]